MDRSTSSDSLSFHRVSRSVDHERHRENFRNTMQQIVRHKFPSPVQEMVDLKYQLNCAIERQSNQQTAIALMSVEQERKIHRQRLNTILNELLMKLRRQLAKQACVEEQENQILMLLRLKMCDELRRRVNQSQARLAVDKEFKNRPSYWTTDPAIIHRCKLAINDNILRRGNQKWAVQAMESERQRRIIQNNMSILCENLVRKVNQMRVDALVEQERHERVTRELFHDVCDQIRRQNNTTTAIRSADIEQRERITQQEKYQEIHPSQLTVYFGPTVVDSVKELMHCDVRRYGNQIEADRLMDIERLERIQKNNLASVLDDLRRKVARTTSAAAMNTEQAMRSTQRYFTQTVCPQLRSTISRKEIFVAVAREQQMRIESGILRTYWVVDPAVISETKHDINRSIDAMGNKMSSCAASDEELYSRIVEMKMRQTLAQLVSIINRATARKAEMLEQAQRVTIDKTHKVCEELRRVVARNSAATALDKEQKSRITDAAPDRNGNSIIDIEIKKSACMQDVMRAIERLGNQKWVRDSTKEEQNARIVAHNMHEVCDSIRRCVAKRSALKALTEEQEWLTNRRCLKVVVESLVSSQNRKAAAIASRMEQQRQILQKITPPQNYRDLHNIICREVKSPTCLIPLAPIGCM